MRRLLCLVVLLSGLAGAQILPLGIGRHFGAQPNPNPLTLPLAQSNTPIFTFLGSFASPIKYGATAMSVSGSNLYLASNYYDPADTNIYVQDGGMGEITIPALSGAPAYNGSNGVAGLVQAVTAPADFVAPANYTLTGAPSTGATSATFTSLPPGFAGDANPTNPNGTYDWFVKFTGTNSPDVPVTALAGSTFSWLGGLTGSGYSTTVSVHRWHPHNIFGNASGYRLTGSFVTGGNVYVTGGTYYDSGCNQQKGWVSQVSTNLSFWGVPNTPAANATQILGGSSLTQYSRRYAGQIQHVPSIWQGLITGGPNYVIGGQGLSILGCDIPIGFGFTTFDPATVSTSANAVALTPYLDYFNQGSQPQPGNPKMLSYRVFNTGPFGSASGTYTLTGAPSPGATSVTLAAAWPNNAVTGYYNATSLATAGTNTTTLVAAAPSGNWPSNWATNYWVGGFLFDLTHNSILTSQGCRIGSSTAVTAGSSGTMTVTCFTSALSGMVSGDTYALSDFSSEKSVPYLMTFSDGEQRVVQLTLGISAVPATGFPTAFATLTGCSTGTCSAAPLLCSPSCTSTVTIQALGDQLSSESDGALGTGFIEPGSKSFLVISTHLFGPQSGVPLPNGVECRPGASSSNLLPFAPDTTDYNDIQVTAYDLSVLLQQKIGSPNPIYQVTPYSQWTFPGWQNLTYRADQCFYGGTNSAGNGYATYDEATSKLYISSFNFSTGNVIIYEYAVASM